MTQRSQINLSTDELHNLSFDEKGLLWIQTDGNYSNEKDFAGQGNNQMLIGDPATGEIRRFLVGPKQAEITGVAWAADRRTVFVGVQHPGERGESNWPDGGDKTPRSSIIAIRRDDGAALGRGRRFKAAERRHQWSGFGKASGPASYFF